MSVRAWTRRRGTPEGKPRAGSAVIYGRRGAAFLGILLFAVQAVLYAQEPSLEELPGLRERAVVMRIVSRVVEQNQEVVWNSENSRTTIPGRPVGLKLVSSNLVVAVQFTPFLRQNGRHILVAQGQIWINVPDEGISYHTTMQTIPLEFREQVYFFPLGPEVKAGARIEIQLTMEPYSESSAAVNAGGAAVPDNAANSGVAPGGGGSPGNESAGSGVHPDGENLTPP